MSTDNMFLWRTGENCPRIIIEYFSIRNLGGYISNSEICIIILIIKL